MIFIGNLFYKLRHLGFALIILVVASTAWGKTSLVEHYHRLKNGSSTTLPGTRINLASSEQEDLLSAEINSILHKPFEVVAAALSNANNWCQVLPLHFNIKACTYDARDGAELLTVYSGRKIYEAPEDSYEMSYQFEVLQHDDQQLSLRLHANDGPMGTSDYLIELHAIPVTEGTLLQIHSSYHPSWLSSMLTSAYLSTVGSSKTGFSHVEQGGETQPVKGIRGIIERNVMRYHLAINAFLNTQSLLDETRHEAMLTSWFNQHERYSQLHEMSKAEYLEIKREELQNQQQLQRTLDEGLQLAEVSDYDD